MLLHVLRFIRLVLIEGPIVILSVYMLSGTKFDRKKMIIAGFGLGILIFVVRLLPIHTGVHTILLAICIILVGVYYFKINLFKVATSMIAFIVILMVCEAINMLIINSALNVESDFYYNTAEGFLLMIPSLLAAFLIVSGFSYLRKRTKGRN